MKTILDKQFNVQNGQLDDAHAVDTGEQPYLIEVSVTEDEDCQPPLDREHRSRSRLAEEIDEVHSTTSCDHTISQMMTKLHSTTLQKRLTKVRSAGSSARNPQCGCRSRGRNATRIGRAAHVQAVTRFLIPRGGENLTNDAGRKKPIVDWTKY